SPGWLWMYDKLQGTRKLLPVKQVAQEAGFYTDAVEESLTRYVEKPANAAIDRIRRGEALGEVDRTHLAYYLGTMIRRVPRARARAYAMAPKVLGDTARNVREQFEAGARAGCL